MDEEKSIKHLVVSGGGTYGLSAYGALRELSKKGFWDISNIKSCHATSIGTIILAMILCKYEWDILDDFIIKRPWNTVFNFDISQLFEVFDRGGIFDRSVIFNALKPIFSGADMDMNITMKEFYEKTGIEFYIYSVEINAFELECISHKTYPHMPLIDACYTSCSLPILFKPLTFENKSYIDGGIFLNYPILECLNIMNAEPEEVLGIRKIIDDEKPNSEMVQSFNLLEYVMYLVKSIMQKVNVDIDDKENNYENEIYIHMESITFESISDFANSEEYRKKLITIGVEKATEFLNKREK
jgi:NTE family protein